MVGVYENKTKKHAAHTGKAIKGFLDYDYFGYNHCIYASHKPAYNRDARKTDFDENAKYYYNITKENFDRIAYILRKCLDVYLNDNILLKSLEIFHNSNGFLSPYISKSNIPWIICELGLSGQNLFGQHIKKDSAMYKVIEKIPAALFAESTIKGYSKFDFSNAKNEDFQIGLTSILECLVFTVERGAIPKLPTIWWEHIKSRYANNSNNDFAFSGDIWVNEDNYE